MIIDQVAEEGRASAGNPPNTPINYKNTNTITEIQKIRDKWTNSGAAGEVGTGDKAGLTGYTQQRDWEEK